MSASQPASLLSTRRPEPAAAPAAARTLVVGYGSPIRGDDAIGPLAADALAAGPLPPGLRVLSRHVLTAELAEDLAAVDRVIFLDAAVQGPPGEVRVRQLGSDAHAMSTMGHFLDPRELLAWCETLYRRVPQAWLVSAAAHSFDYACYRLSPAATAAVPAMLAEVHRLLATPLPCSG
ncbi:MAG TPA: hydrogenase maturation protease [Rubrivivax sp.]|nr:hydrogenase maturation protease [Rubrivivax sp.]